MSAPILAVQTVMIVSRRMRKMWNLMRSSEVATDKVTTDLLLNRVFYSHEHKHTHGLTSETEGRPRDLNMCKGPLVQVSDALSRLEFCVESGPIVSVYTGLPAYF